MENSSEDLHKRVTDQTLQRNCPMEQMLAPFRPWDFLHSWLRYTAANGIILREPWQSMQGSLDLVLKRWEFFGKIRNYSYERAWDQNHWELGKIHPVTGETRLFLFGGFSSLTTVCRNWITCNVHRTMTSWREELPRIRIAASLSLRLVWMLLCIKTLPVWTVQSICMNHMEPVQGY